VTATAQARHALVPSKRRLGRLSARHSLPVLVALGVGALMGAMIGMGGSLLLMPAAGVVALLFALALRRAPGMLPVLALAVACTPPLVFLPLSVTVGGKSLFLSDLLLPLATVLALSVPSRIPKLDLVTWGYTIVIALEAAVGLVHRQPFSAFTQDLRGPIYLVCGYFIASRLVTRSRLRKAVGAAAIVLWYSAGLMIVTIATGVEILAGRTEEVRAYQASGNAEVIDATRFIVDSKGLAFMALVVAVTVLFSRPVTSRQRWLCLALAVPAFIVTFLSYARATLIALVVCTVVVVVLKRAVSFDRRRVLATGAVLATVVGLVGLTGTASLLNDANGNVVARQVAGFEERVLGGLTSDTVDSPGNTYRLMENRYALEAAARSPLFGHGIGASFKPTTFGDRSLSAFENDPAFGTRFIHNGWLWYLVKAGGVGVLAFILFVFTPVLRTLLPRAGRTWRIDPVDAGLAVAIVGLMIINAFEPDLHRTGTAPLAGAVLGYLALRSAAARGTVGARPVAGVAAGPPRAGFSDDNEVGGHR
jgi:O-antigen ligase